MQKHLYEIYSSNGCILLICCICQLIQFPLKKKGGAKKTSPQNFAKAWKMLYLKKNIQAASKASALLWAQGLKRVVKWWDKKQEAQYHLNFSMYFFLFLYEINLTFSTLQKVKMVPPERLMHPHPHHWLKIWLLTKQSQSDSSADGAAEPGSREGAAVSPQTCHMGFEV